ncbi:cytochrome [Wenjunlia vitaminophila]|uniref:Cytochrome n=1 Tax=Wenjunlia vitaminophila TaxID=76728 RepID=A0A0T6LX00_WENVI|nr:cytochrome P450 [Wenjunlia vitaminophila]KRV50553.1 cytochrome [Wenjunlia vitaminophila]
MVVPRPTPISGPLRRSSQYLRSIADLAQHPYTGAENLYRTYGPVWQLGTGRHSWVYLLGPEANRFVFANSHLFRWREAFEQLIPVDGETALIVSDGEDHRRRRRLVAPAFHRQAIDGYVDVMRDRTDAAIDTWLPGRTLDLYQELRTVVRRITIQVLFGSRLAADEDELGRLLQRVLDLINESPIVQRVQRLGLPSYRRAIRARQEVARRVLVEIDHRRRNPGTDIRDVFSLLVETRDEDGGALSEVEILDQVISLIAAGYDSTSAAVSWAVHAMAQSPKIWQRAKEEVERVVPDDRPLTAADVPRLEYLDRVVNETMRLYPAAPFNARKAAVPFTFQGHRIPQGSLLVLSPYVTHRLPEVYSDPLRFDPDRWDPELPGYRKPGPHEFLPYGGGLHRCIGATFATVEMKVILARVLRRVEFRFPRASYGKPIGFTVMRPDRLPARVAA